MHSCSLPKGRVRSKWQASLLYPAHGSLIKNGSSESSRRVWIRELVGCGKVSRQAQMLSTQLGMLGWSLDEKSGAHRYDGSIPTILCSKTLLVHLFWLWLPPFNVALSYTGSGNFSWSWRDQSRGQTVIESFLLQVLKTREAPIVSSLTWTHTGLRSQSQMMHWPRPCFCVFRMLCFEICLLAH